MSRGGRAAAIIVGAGMMGRWHADAVRRIGGRVVAVVDPDAARAGLLARRHGAVPVGRLEEALQLGDAAVHVCTPVHHHVGICRTALEAERHVIVEKPFAPDAASTAALLELAERAGRIACPVHQFLFQPGVHHLLESIRDIGPLVHVRLTACSAGAGAADADRADAVAADILPHALALIDRLTSAGVDSLVWDAGRPAGGEIRASAVAGSASVEVLVSMRARPTRNELEVLATHGSAWVDLYHGYAVTRPGGVSRSRKIVQPFDFAARTLAAATGNLLRRTARREPAYPGLRELIRRFHEATTRGGPPPIGPAETLRVARARDRLLAALGGAADQTFAPATALDREARR